MEKYCNLIIIGFIIALIVLSIFWAFNTVRRIEINKNYCASSLTGIAKLWRRAKFIPEDAKERESLYLYRDFLRKFDEENCKYPIMVKNGGVRVMTRQEYDKVAGFKSVRCFSPLTLLASVLVAIVALIVNLTVTKMVWVGIGLALIMPIEQLILFFFLNRFDKDKNIYRDGIFLALKENSINFLSIAKPFIIVDAYPKKFGKKSKPLYLVKGDLTAAQIKETRDFIVQQKQAESKVELRTVDNEDEIQKIINPLEVDDTEEITTETAMVETTPKKMPKKMSTEEDLPEMSDEEREIFIDKLVDDLLSVEVDRALEQAKAEKGEATATETKTETATETNTVPEAEAVTENETVVPEAKNAEPIPVEEVPEPAEDDFSLEAIGQALDAEIAKRNKRK